LSVQVWRKYEDFIKELSGEGEVVWSRCDNATAAQ
jgi:hypothetical protein